ncbi:MAG: hypothetical protein HOE90_16420 [Bacteriovoracaceae bacterium]|jgi:cell division protein FtsB|nr:hypothetical protein [Bacteriovoracaceae bacterium]
MGLGSGTSEAVGSDALKKAIERNRAKRAKRDKAPSSYKKQTELSLFSPKSKSKPKSRPKAKLPRSPLSFDEEMAPVPRKSNRSSRRSRLAGIEDIEFSGPLRKPPRKAPASISYLEKPAQKRKRAGKSGSKLEKIFVKLGWVSCLVLAFRLIFAGGGLLDFYNMDKVLVSKSRGLASIKEENQNLKDEIIKIRTNRKYQKKLARTHLGVISSEEYLVLFATDSSLKTK